MQDGWQTSRHAKKARKWDMLAEEKRNLLAKIETAQQQEYEDKTRYYCKRFHNQWWENSMLHGAGKYVYTGFECQKCKVYHYEFKLNTSDEKEKG